MSVVLPLPLPPRSPHYLSRPSTPTSSSSPNRLSRPSTPSPTSSSRISRPSTPTPMSTISAPPTPITSTHLIPLVDIPCGAGMERCQSSEAVLGRPLSLGGTAVGGHEMVKERSRDGRRRDVKATSLLFKTVPSMEQIQAAERDASPPQDILLQVDKAENEDLDSRVLEKMDVDQEGEVREIDPSAEPTNGDEIQDPVDVKDPDQPVIWGMPVWGREEERKEVRPGVRLVGMEELPGLIDRHSMLDVPSHVLFPWLHGICDDGHRGRDMAGFFGHIPPFEPPPYRGLCVMLSPPHPLDEVPDRPKPKRSESGLTAQPPMSMPLRERSETMSTSSESYYSSAGTTEGTSPSLMSWTESNSPKMDTPPTPQTGISSVPVTPDTPATFPGRPFSDDPMDKDSDEIDVVMHPLESKRVSPEAINKGLDQPSHPLPCDYPVEPATPESATHAREDSSDDSEMEEEDDDDDESRPSCILLNALHVKDVFDLPHGNEDIKPRFKPARLPPQINLRNLNIQQIKYATISDIVLYARNGVGPGVLEVATMIAHAQETLWQDRMNEYYAYHKCGEGEGLDQPVKYGVWVVVEPFSKIEKHCPDLVCVDSRSNLTSVSSNVDLFEREAYESRAMTRGSEVLENFWVGNDCDVPGGADDGAGARMTFDLCLRASECFEMPSQATLNSRYRQIQDLDRRRRVDNSPTWSSSPATLALRHLLSPNQIPTPVTTESSKRAASPSPSDDTSRQQRSRFDNAYISLECSGSCRTITGQMRNINSMTEKIVDLVYFLRKVIESKDAKGRPMGRKVLVHCQDGYTESSIVVLSYIMCSLNLTLPEAYIYLQDKAKRSFFLYTSDKPLLKRIDAKLQADRKPKPSRVIESPPPSPTTRVDPISNGHARSQSSRWKSWGMGLANGHSRSNSETSVVMDKGLAPPPLAAPVCEVNETVDEEALKKLDIWFGDKRFDGFPSRILPFLYLGNLDHAGNAAMLHALGISHVVSVGESLIVNPALDSAYGKCGDNTLAFEAAAGRIQVLDLTDVRDDGNDPLRPLIARACAWIEQARQSGGNILVHCRVGVSRSASIVIAYMMQYQRIGLMDAYLVTRARRLNVLIQPNLRFFHEMFGWEVELAKRDLEEARLRRAEAEKAGVRDPQALELIDQQYKRKIIYSWPAFCRDVHCLNRRFLCQ